MCIHGKCREGQSTCDGNCDKGWIGDDCEIPFEEDKLKNVYYFRKEDRKILQKMVHINLKRTVIQE